MKQRLTIASLIFASMEAYVWYTIQVKDGATRYRQENLVASVLLALPDIDAKQVTIFSSLILFLSQHF